MKQFYVYIFTTLGSTVFAETKASWEHSWKTDTGYLTVLNCTGQKCDVRFSGGGCQFDGKLSTSDENNAKVIALDYNKEEKNCVISLQQKQKDLSAEFTGADCGYFCISNSKLPKSFRFRSEKPYLAERLHQECTLDDRISVQIWCTSSKLQELHHRYEDLLHKIDDLLVQHNYAPRTPWLDSIWASCEKDKSTEECLALKYHEKLSQLENDLKDAKDTRDKRYADLFTPGDKAIAKRTLNEIAGVYKKRFKNGLVDGTKYESENILELVPISDDAIYFKTALNFFNAHTCSLFGVARFNQSGNLVFQDSSDSHCILQIKLNKNELEFSDDPEKPCRQSYCGARGGFNEIKFSRSSKRPIRYMKTLLNSNDYKQSVETFSKPSPAK